MHTLASKENEAIKQTLSSKDSLVIEIKDFLAF